MRSGQTWRTRSQGWTTSLVAHLAALLVLGLGVQVSAPTAVPEAIGDPWQLRSGHAPYVLPMPAIPVAPADAVEVAPTPAMQEADPAVDTVDDTPPVEQPMLLESPALPLIAMAPSPAPTPASAPAPAIVQPELARPSAAPAASTSGVVSRVRPIYPARSRRLGEHGTVTLRVLVDENGRPRQVDILRSSGHAALDDSARAAVLHWRFTRPDSIEPAERVVNVEFRIQ